MEYELKVLEHIISVVLKPSKLTLEKLNDEFLSECKLHIETEKERIMKQFTTVVFSRNSESHFELYFRQHQNSLVLLADIVFKYLQPEGPESIYRLTNEVSILNFYNELSKIPEELLDFIAKNFSKYFDQEVKVPDAKRWMMAPEIKRKLKLIQKKLKENKVQNDLIKIICRPFEDYLLTETIISYHELSYLKELQQEFLTFTTKKDKTNANERFCYLLLELNYNSIPFFNYYVLHIEEMAKGCNSIQDLIEFYSLKIKLINQVSVKPKFIFKLELPSIKELIGSWICEELYYLEKQERYLYLEPGQKAADQSKVAKIHTSLSVSHLAMAVKLLVEAKVITNTNSRDLMRMVARNFKTDRQEVISEESLWNKSYSFESSTVNRLKDEIIGLMNLARKY